MAAKLPSKRVAELFKDQKFDIVFIDPPFSANMLSEVLRWVTLHLALSDQVMIYVEMPKNEALVIPEGWEFSRDKSAGQVRYGLLVKQ